MERGKAGEKFHGPYKLPEGWKWVRLNEVSYKPQYGYTTSAVDSHIGPKFLRITDIQDGKVKWDSVPYCQISDSDFEKYKIEKDEIFFARTGATTGKSYLINDISQNAVFASYLIRVKLYKDKVLPNYVYLFFQSPQYWNQIIPQGGAQPNMNAQKLMKIFIPIPIHDDKPNLEEQGRIVEKIETLFEKLDKAKELIKQSKKEAEELLQSALHQVFSKADEKGWRWVRLGEIFSIEYGKKVENKYRIDDGEYWAYGSNGRIYRVINFLIEPPAIIIGRKGSVGSINLIKERFWPIDTTFYAKVKIPLYSIDYLYWSLSYFDLSKLTITTTKPGLNREDLKSFKIPIPFINGKPYLEEQKCIVAYLDKIAEKQKDLLKLYNDSEREIEEMKQSILQKAFRGEL